jgi:hypothetical protein
MASRIFRFFLATVAVAASTSLYPVQAWASRTPPPEVAPVVYQNVKYVAVIWGWTAGYDQNGGIIEAQDPVTHAKLWSFEVYDVVYDHSWETDVQDIFISSMTLEGSSLMVENERGDIYRVDLTAPPNSEQFIVQLQTPGNADNRATTSGNADNRATTSTGCSFAHSPLRATAMPFIFILGLLATYHRRNSVRR